MGRQIRECHPEQTQSLNDIDRVILTPDIQRHLRKV